MRWKAVAQFYCPFSKETFGACSSYGPMGSPAEFDKAELDWRETVGRMYKNMSNFDEVPTPLELDGNDKAIDVIEGHVAQVTESANNWIADTEEWAKVAKARIEAMRK